VAWAKFVVSPGAGYAPTVRNPIKNLKMMNSKKIEHIKLFVILTCFFINISCEVDRSTIGLEEQPQYSYNYINDYDFIYNRYFFVDTCYSDRYEKGFSDDLLIWSYEEGTSINELNVYKSASYSQSNARRGVAAIPSRMEEFENLQNLDGVLSEAGEVEVANFVPLEEGKHYEYDNARGILRLNQTIKDMDILAVAYKTDLKTVGTLFSTINDTDSTKFYVLSLVKPHALRIEHEEVWQLTIKNVYALGDSNIFKDGFNIAIRKQESHETIQQENPKHSFLNLTGLDIMNDKSEMVVGGDKVIDHNPFLVDRIAGILMFPGLQPFDPLPESRFQLADTNRARIYSSINKNYLAEFSKFEIVVQYISN
jgi:hypothetical protein